MSAPLPTLVDRHLRAPPAAKGPRAAVQSGMSTASLGTASVLILAQADGSEVGHCAESALVRQSTMSEPTLLNEIAEVARHCAASPTAKTPRLVRQKGTLVTSSRPFESPREEQAEGNDISQDVEGPLTAVQTTSALPLPPSVVLDNPRAFSRQVMIPVPEVESVMSEADKQVNAEPTANGPRLVTQSAASGTIASPFSVDSFWQAFGSAVIQLLLRESDKQLTMEDPLVLKLITDEDRQVKVFPIAKGPSVVTQPSTRGISARPFAFERLLQAFGSVVAHADGAGPPPFATQVVATALVVVATAAADVAFVTRSAG